MLVLTFQVGKNPNNDILYWQLSGDIGIPTYCWGEMQKYNEYGREIGSI